MSGVDKCSYLLIGPDFAQIEEKYGKTGLETLLSTTAAKIVLPLNNESVAKRFSEMVGQFTHEGETKSRTHGFSKQARRAGLVSATPDILMFIRSPSISNPSTKATTRCPASWNATCFGVGGAT
jgi:hypothetical protein